MWHLTKPTSRAPEQALLASVRTFADKATSALDAWGTIDDDARAAGTRAADNVTMLSALRQNLGEDLPELQPLAAVVESEAARAHLALTAAAEAQGHVATLKDECAAALDMLLQAFVRLERSVRVRGPGDALEAALLSGGVPRAAEPGDERQDAAAGVLATRAAGHLYYGVANLQLRGQPPLPGARFTDRVFQIGAGEAGEAGEAG
jgi:hypothetical protein